MSEQAEQVQSLYKTGLSTGEIAVALGWERNPASRRKIRAMLEGRETVNRLKKAAPVAEGPFVDYVKQIEDESKKGKVKKFQFKGYRFYSGVGANPTSTERVQRSTGHREYQKRLREALWIVARFERFECKFKGRDAEFLERLDFSNISADDLFRLRDMLSRRKL